MNVNKDYLVSEVGVSNGMKTEGGVEFVAILGMNFQRIMKPLLVSQGLPSTISDFILGKYATGTIVQRYTSGSWIPVIVDITTNHGVYFSFKLCPNNDISQDPDQRCFDKYILQV